METRNWQRSTSSVSRPRSSRPKTKPSCALGPIASSAGSQSSSEIGARIRPARAVNPTRWVHPSVAACQLETGRRHAKRARAGAPVRSASLPCQSQPFSTRVSPSPKFSQTRAANPRFAGFCGSTRIIVGGETCMDGAKRQGCKIPVPEIRQEWPANCRCRGTRTRHFRVLRGITFRYPVALALGNRCYDPLRKRESLPTNPSPAPEELSGTCFIQASSWCVLAPDWPATVVSQRRFCHRSPRCSRSRSAHPEGPEFADGRPE